MPKKSEWSRRTTGGSTKKQMTDRAVVLDGFSSPRIATIKLLRHIKLQKRIWEPANGFGKISLVLGEKGFKTTTSDIHKWHKSTQWRWNFLKRKRLPNGKAHDIVTNPPFVKAQEFVERSMKLLEREGKLCLLLRLQFLESQKRMALFKAYPPKEVLIFSKRLPRMRRFGFKGKQTSSALAFAWFVWEKGYTGQTTVRWI